MTTPIDDTTMYGFLAGTSTPEEREEVHEYLYDNDSVRRELLKMVAMLEETQSAECW